VTLCADWHPNLKSCDTLLENAQLVTYFNVNLSALKGQILQGRVPGLLDVMVFKMLNTGRYVVFTNVVG
tara:strand:- start:14384 stop:14590 length:207 start_codon:yes stop_codon:yes gene_type:complete